MMKFQGGNPESAYEKIDKAWMGGGGGMAYPYLNFPNQPPVNNRGIANYFRGVVYAACQRQADRISQTRLALYDPGMRKTKAKYKHVQLKSYEIEALYDRKPDAKNFAQRDQTGISELTDHPALQVIRRPNPFLTEMEYRNYDELYQCVTGVTYERIMWLDDEPIQLWMLPPHAVMITTDPFTGLPVAANYMGEPIPLKDLLVQTCDNLLDPYGAVPGVSATRSVLDKLRLHDFVTEKLIALMNAPKFSGIFSPKGEDNVFSPEQYDRMLGKLEQFRHGRQSDFLLNDSELSFQSILQNPTDLASLEIYKMIRADVAMAFSQPMMILSGTEGNSRASYEASVQEWMDTCINPRLRKIENHLNHRFLPLFKDSDGLYFAFDDPTPDALRDQGEIFTMLCGGPLLEINEGRQRLGYGPTKDGDVVRMAAGAAPTPNTSQGQKPDPPPKDTTEDDLKAVLQEVQGLKDMVAKLVTPTPKKKTQKTGLLPPRGNALDGFKAVLRKHFAEWRKSLDHVMPKAMADISVKQLDPTHWEVKGLPGSFIPNADWVKGLADDSQMFFTEGGKKLLGRVGASPDVYNVFNPKVAEYAKQASLNFAESTVRTTSKSLNEALDKARQEIGEALSVGTTIDDLSDRIGTIFETLSDQRCDLIARTESNRSFNEGLRESAKDSGVVKGFRWLTTSEPCDECADLDDTFIDLDGEMPPAHPACECCVTEELIEGDE